MIGPVSNPDAIRRRIVTELLQQLPQVERDATTVRSLAERLIRETSATLAPDAVRSLSETAVGDFLALQPLLELLTDPRISEIHINSTENVFAKRRGRSERTDLRFADAVPIEAFLGFLLRQAGRSEALESPRHEFRTPGGLAVRAVLPPLAPSGPVLILQQLAANLLRLDDLLNLRTMTPEMTLLLEAAVKSRLTVVISGGSRTGKTTLLHALSGFIPNDEVIGSVGEPGELRLTMPYLYRLESQEEALTARELVQTALGLRTDRIVLGECRGGETRDFLRAVSIGRQGSLTTVRSGDPVDALYALEKMVLSADRQVSIREARRLVVHGIALIAQLDLLPGGRHRLTSLAEVVRDEQQMAVRELFRYRQLGLGDGNRGIGQFEATGVRPGFLPRFEAVGIRLPPNLFEARVLLRD